MRLRISSFLPGGVVGFDDALDDGEADDVFGEEVDKFHTFDVLQDFDGFAEAGLHTAAKVDLRGIAGDDASGTFAEAGEEHEHLLGGGVDRKSVV